MGAVSVALAFTEGNQKRAFGTVGQFGFHVGLAAPQQQRADAAAQLVEITVAARSATFVKLVELTVKPEQRPEHGWIEKTHQ